MRYIQLDEVTEAAFRDICSASLEFKGRIPVKELVEQALSKIKEGNPAAK